jgi:hypothetical protein
MTAPTPPLHTYRVRAEWTRADGQIVAVAEDVENTHCAACALACVDEPGDANDVSYSAVTIRIERVPSAEAASL